MRKIHNLIREARADQDQTAFGLLLGKSQAQVSKYESGSASPPKDVIEKCMAILEKNNSPIADDVSIEKLAERVRTELGKPQHSFIRKSLALLLDGLR